MGNPTRKHYRALDSFRGLAALFIAWYHFRLGWTYAPSAYLCVDFFFILSGFVICHAYLDRPERMPLDVFVSHRLARLYPLHLAAMLFLLLLLVFAGVRPECDTSPRAWLLNLAMLQSVGLTESVSWNAPAWSISTELWANLFFFAFPLIWRNKATPVFLALGLAVLCKPGSNAHSENVFFLNTGLMRCAFGFLLGVGCYRLHQRLKDQAAKVRAPWWTLLELLPLPLALALIYDANHSRATAMLFLPVSAALIFIYAFERGLVSRLMGALRLHWLGLISYSVYLLHMPLRLLLTATPLQPLTRSQLAMTGLILSVAAASFLCLERPLTRRLRNSFTVERLRLAPILVFLALALASFVAVAWATETLPSPVRRIELADLAELTPKTAEDSLNPGNSLRFHQGLAVSVPAGRYQSLELALFNAPHRVQFLRQGRLMAEESVEPLAGAATRVALLVPPNQVLDEVRILPQSPVNNALGYFSLIPLPGP